MPAGETTTTSSIASSMTTTTTEDDEEEQVAPPITLTSTPESSSTWIEVEHDEGTIVEQETNQLFLWVLSVVISMYALLSLCFRKVFKSRRQTQYVNLNNTELSVLTSSN
jgi:hypothetical protein